MGDVLFLAWCYLKRHKGKTLILLVCLTLALALPMVVRGLVDTLHTQMLDRAQRTPLVIGPEGSRFDLVLHALYFRTAAPGTIGQGERDAIQAHVNAATIPLFIRYQAGGYPIVGTTLDYFGFRDLNVIEGSLMTRLGDCVVGWEVAQALDLSPGDRLISDPQNVFELGGSYPLNMRVTGVLGPSQSPDDRAVFVDVKTAWIIEGIGHGHEDLNNDADEETILERNEDQIVASPALQEYTKVTDENIHTFHFHGDPDDFPLTAILAVPDDARAAALLRGRYVGEDAAYQALRPQEVVEQLMGLIVQLRRFFDVHHLFMVGVTLLLVGLVMSLSLRLRRGEMQTMYFIGCSRGMMIALQAAELLILLSLSIVLALAASWTTIYLTRAWIQGLTG